MTVTPVAVTSPGTTPSFTGYVNDDPSTATAQASQLAILGAAADAASLTTTIKAALRGIATATGITSGVTLATQGYGGTAVTFTPAASSHTAGDCNGAAGSFTSMGPSAAEVMITSASLMIFGATVEVTAWRLHLYNVTPPSAYADDTAWDLLTGDRASYLGFIDLGTAVDVGGTQWIEVNGLTKQVRLAGTGVWGYLVNLTTLTPANVSHDVKLHSVAI
jgi:hypothetical protein